MANTTVTIGRQSFSVPTSSDAGTSLVLGIFNSAQLLPLGYALSSPTNSALAEIVPLSPPNVVVAPTTTTVIDINPIAHTVTGGGGTQQVLLNGANATYLTGKSLSSFIVAADNTNSTIVNNTTNGSMVAVTGAGASAVVGGGSANAIATGPGGSNAVLLNGTANSLDSSGTDQIIIDGRTARVSLVAVEATGTDTISLVNGASVNLVNNSAFIATVSGSNGSQVTVSGSGNTQVTAGTGNEILNATASTGNVTLTGGSGNTVMAGGKGSDTFSFVRGQAGGQYTIVNFTAADTLALTGYGPTGAITGETLSGGSVVLTLADSSRITFQSLPILNPAQIKFG